MKIKNRRLTKKISRSFLVKEKISYESEKTFAKTIAKKIKI